MRPLIATIPPQSNSHNENRSFVHEIFEVPHATPFCVAAIARKTSPGAQVPSGTAMVHARERVHRAVNATRRAATCIRIVNCVSPYRSAGTAPQQAALRISQR
jgi:hypothetical protein